MSSAGVAFEAVSKQFGAVDAVRDLSLQTESGEFLVLVGPSGCGKTTALRMVAGLEEPTSGRIFIDGRDVTATEAKDRDIAMVFQSYALYPHMTVQENLAFGLKQRKTPRAEIERRVAEAAGMLDIGHLLKRRPRELSGGQRQRVALGRAIVRRPAVFLMDEPLSNLDAQLRLRTRAELAQLHRTLGTTFIYVTHDQVEAMTMGSRIAVMRDGVLQQVDRPQTLYDRPANTFVATFIGSPPMNLLTGELTGQGDALEFVADGIRLRLPAEFGARAEGERRVMLGIRPEHFERAPAAAGGEGVLEGTAALVEPHGSDLFVSVKTAAGDVTARLDPAYQVRLGDAIRLRPVLAGAHLFEAGQGRRLG